PHSRCLLEDRSNLLWRVLDEQPVWLRVVAPSTARGRRCVHFAPLSEHYAFPRARTTPALCELDRALVVAERTRPRIGLGFETCNRTLAVWPAWERRPGARLSARGRAEGSLRHRL